MSKKIERSRINEHTFYVKYKDVEGFTWELGSLYPSHFQTLSEFILEDLKEDELAGRIQVLDVKSFIVKEVK